MTKYNIFQNAVYVYSKANVFDKKYKYKLITSLLLQLLIPVFSTFIPTLVVYMVTNGFAIRSFVLDISLVVSGFILINYIYSILSYDIDIENIYIRTLSFWRSLSHKSMFTGYENMENQKTKDKMNKAAESISSNWVGVELLLKRFPSFVISFFGLLMFSTYIMSINFWIVVLLLAMTVINLVLNAYARKFEKKNAASVNRYFTKLKYFQDESKKLVNAKDIRIYKMENWFYKGIKFFTKKYSNQVLKQKLRYFYPNLSDSIFTIARDFLAYSILVAMVVNGSIGVTEFTFMIGIVTGFSSWLNQLSYSYGNLKEANISINNFRDYISLDDKMIKGKKPIANQMINQKLSIEFRDVSFTYPEAEKATLINLSFKIEAGEKIALVGVNGAGKTTIVKLICGLYYPTEGDILINGISVFEINTEEHHKLISAIFQDINILAFTIEQNITCQEETEVDQERFFEVLQQSGLADKIAGLKNREKTYLMQDIDQDGIMLSGGELQKMMLARALYKDAPILILDEPTAALDPLAEQELYLKYNSLTENKTSVFISHRLSSTQFCDRILYIEDGKICEEGSHKSLMDINGKYANMFDIQSQYYSENIPKEEQIYEN